MSLSTSEVLGALKRWGHHATSFQILEPGYTYWVDPETSGIVAFVRRGRYRIAAGMPIGPADALGSIGARFIADATANGEQALFLQTDEAFLMQLRREPIAHPVDSVPIGSQPEWNPARYSTDGPKRKGLRAQLNRARNKGVVIQSISPADFEDSKGALMAQVEVVLQRWLQGRQMSPLSFLVDLQPFVFAEERRFYVALHHDRAVGFLAAVPVYGRRGWFFEDVIRVPEAPNGTVELLIDTALRDAASKGDEYVTLGLAPLADIPKGPGPHKRLRSLLTAAYHRLEPLYRFSGIHAFKGRLKPDLWRPQLLVQSPGRIGIGSLHAILRAFAGGGLVSFFVSTLHRRLTLISPKTWTRILVLLISLLIPWTALLALADGERWFGDVSIQRAWVIFDIVMACALTGLTWLVHKGHRAAKTFSACLAGATAADFVITTVQAFNLHQGVSGLSALFVVAGIAGPVAASLILAALAWSKSEPGSVRRRD